MTGSVTLLCNGRFLVVSYYSTICAGSDRVMYYCVIWARLMVSFVTVQYMLFLVVSFITGQCGLCLVVSFIAVQCGLFRAASFIAVQCGLFRAA